MKDQVNLLLKEIVEHTSDCDYNRNAHFKQYNYYKSEADKSNHKQIISIIITLCLSCMSQIGVINNILQGLGIKDSYDIIKNGSDILTLISACYTAVITTKGLYHNYSELANKHWIAAQSYQQLYRRCQFFYHHNLNNISVESLTQVLKEITEELNTLNIQSPHIEGRFFAEVNKAIKDKKYPLEYILENENNTVIQIINKYIGKGCVDVYLFGKSIKEGLSNDKDVAIIFEDDISEEEMFKLAGLCKVEANTQDIKLDIFVIHKTPFYTTDEMFYKNIYKGKLICSGLDKKNLDIVSKEIKCIQKYYQKAQEAIEKEDYLTYSIYAYYTYYHLMARELKERNYKWDSEQSIKIQYFKCMEGLLNEDEVLEMNNYINQVEQYKNRILLQYEIDIPKQQVELINKNLQKMVILPNR